MKTPVFELGTAQPEPVNTYTHRVLFSGDDEIYTISISRELLQTIGFVILVSSFSFAILMLSIVVFIQSFSCNIKCDLSNKKAKVDQNLSDTPNIQMNETHINTYK